MGLCWRGELASLAGDEYVATDFAERVWNETANSSAKDVSQVTDFFALTTGRAEDWGLPNWDCFDSVRSHLGEIRSTWIDVEQPLALAIVRRAFRQGTWDTSLLCSTCALRDSLYYFPEHDDLPAECWVWLAEHAQHTDSGIDSYYDYWFYAFEAIADVTKPELAHNILAVLLAGLLFEKIPGYIPLSIQRLLKDLSDLHKSGLMPDKRRAAVELAKYVYQKMNPDYLTAADRLAITKAVQESAGVPEGVASFEPSSVESPASSTEQIHPSNLNNAEDYLKTQMSEATWARLTPKAKTEFTHGEFYYIMASKAPGASGNFDGFVMHFSKGLLADIQESLRGPLHKTPSLKGEFLAMFGQTDHPEWSELIVFLNNLDRIAGTTLGKRLLGQRVALRRLGELREFFEKMKSCRNKAAHTRDRIDREEAAVLHDLLLNKGLVRTVVEFFPKAPRR
jgi:hypothetical protein